VAGCGGCPQAPCTHSRPHSASIIFAGQPAARSRAAPAQAPAQRLGSISLDEVPPENGPFVRIEVAGRTLFDADEHVARPGSVTARRCSTLTPCSAQTSARSMRCRAAIGLPACAAGCVAVSPSPSPARLVRNSISAGQVRACRRAVLSNVRHPRSEPRLLSSLS
jgi:hypothetical protein